MIPVEHRMREVVRSPDEGAGELDADTFLSQLMRRDLSFAPKHPKQIIHITWEDTLVQSDPNGTVTEVPEIDLPI